MTPPRQKSELLTNIEMLWHDAEHSADDQAKSTFQRISNLMQDAMATELVANDTAPVSAGPVSAVLDTASSETPVHDAEMDALAALVNEASTSDGQPAADSPHQNASSADAMGDTPSSFEDTKARMDSVAGLKPPHQDSFHSSTPEYAFGAAFTDLVRHVVRDYIHNEVEGVIKNAIKSELDHHFNPQDSDKTNLTGTSDQDQHANHHDDEDNTR